MQTLLFKANSTFNNTFIDNTSGCTQTSAVT